MPLIQVVYTCLLVIALGLMVTGLLLAVRLKKIAVGGTIGKSVDSIIALVVLFLLGYGAALMLPYLGQEFALLLVGSIFLFGAFFVVRVLILIRRLLTRVLSALDTVE